MAHLSNKYIYRERDFPQTFYTPWSGHDHKDYQQVLQNIQLSFRQIYYKLLSYTYRALLGRKRISELRRGVNRLDAFHNNWASPPPTLEHNIVFPRYMSCIIKFTEKCVFHPAFIISSHFFLVRWSLKTLATISLMKNFTIVSIYVCNHWASSCNFYHKLFNKWKHMFCEWQKSDIRTFCRLLPSFIIIKIINDANHFIHRHLHRAPVMYYSWQCLNKQVHKDFWN